MARAAVLFVVALVAAAAPAVPFGGAPMRTAEDLYEAVMSRRLEMMTVSFAPPINCSMIPNGTVHDRATDNVGLFHVVLGERMMVRKAHGASIFVAAAGEDLGAFAAYLPLLNGNSEEIDRLTGGMPTSFAVSLVSRTHRNDPLFATIDFASGRFLVNRDILAYLPAEPSDYIISSYASLSERLQGMRRETFVDDAQAAFLAFFNDAADKAAANPVACFMCFVIVAPIVSIVANFAAAWYGQQICLECSLSDSMCSAVILYLLGLVYQNLPLLAAIAFAICKDLCIIGGQRLAEAF